MGTRISDLVEGEELVVRDWPFEDLWEARRSGVGDDCPGQALDGQLKAEQPGEGQRRTMKVVSSTLDRPERNSPACEP